VIGGLSFPSLLLKAGDFWPEPVSRRTQRIFSKSRTGPTPWLRTRSMPMTG